MMRTGMITLANTRLSCPKNNLYIHETLVGMMTISLLYLTIIQQS